MEMALKINSKLATTLAGMVKEHNLSNFVEQKISILPKAKFQFSCKQ
jgi:hypothetical protein